MYIVRAGEVESKNSQPLEQMARFTDFEKARARALKLLKNYEQVEVIEARTNQCVYFQISQAPPRRKYAKKLQPRELS